MRIMFYSSFMLLFIVVFNNTYRMQYDYYNNS